MSHPCPTLKREGFKMEAAMDDPRVSISRETEADGKGVRA